MSNEPTGAFEFAIDATIGSAMRVKHPGRYVIEATDMTVVSFREYNGAERPIND